MNRSKLPLLIVLVSLFLLLSLKTTRPVSGQDIVEPEYLSLIDGIGVQDPGSIVDFPNRIVIDNNWSDVASTYDWCNGNGTEIDPYIIENISIDGKLQGTVITIRNTDEHFIIRNCYFSLSGRITEHASGIGMINVANGLIIHNNFSANKAAVYVDRSSLVNVTKNIFLGTHTDVVTGLGAAMFISKNSNITVQKNFGLNCYSGIVCFNNIGIKVDGNVIVNELFGYEANGGIFFLNTNYSSITNNTLSGVKVNTISSENLSISDDNTYGIALVSSYFNIVYGNLFIDASNWFRNPNALSIHGYNLIVFAIIVPIVMIRIIKKKKVNFMHSTRFLRSFAIR